MLTIHSSTITEEIAEHNDLQCALVEAANILAAHIQKRDTYSGCPLPAIHAVAIQPAEDMVIPVFLCTLHYNSLKLGLREGVGIDENLLKGI